MSKLTESDLKKQIKDKSFSQIYVIYGTEQMYVKNYTKMLVEAVAGKHPNDFNFHTFKGEINLDELGAAVQVAPFMSEYNCVLIEDAFFDLMSEAELKRLKEICAIRCEGNVVIISMPSNMPAKRKSAFDSIVKTADKSGSVCVFDKQPNNVIERYIAKWANANGKMISRVNAAKLITYVGDDLTALKNEVDKISSYAQGEEITLEDIDKLATVNVESRIFDLSDAVINGNGDRAYKVLDTLFYQKEEPIVMLYTLSNAYIDAYRMRVANECGVSKNDVAKDFDYKRRAFALDRASRATSRVSTDALRKSIDILTEADLNFKSVRINPRLYMEQLIAQLLITAQEGRR